MASFGCFLNQVHVDQVSVKANDISKTKTTKTHNTTHDKAKTAVLTAVLVALRPAAAAVTFSGGEGQRPVVCPRATLGTHNLMCRRDGMGWLFSRFFGWPVSVA